MTGASASLAYGSSGSWKGMVGQLLCLRESPLMRRISLLSPPLCSPSCLGATQFQARNDHATIVCGRTDNRSLALAHPIVGEELRRQIPSGLELMRSSQVRVSRLEIAHLLIGN